MSKNVKELRERASEGKLDEGDLRYIKAREGVPAFDAVLALVDDDISFDEVDDDEVEDDPTSELSYQELKDALDAREVEYRGNASADELRGLLREAMEDD